MKNPLRIMIAEDTLEAREILVEELKQINQNYELFIEECESPTKVFSKLSEYANQNKYFDVIFADIDFQEAKAKGGKRDSGFEIINRAFNTCPFTKICTYSGQFREFDLSEQHQDMVRKGLVVYSFDKSHQGAGEKDWFKKGFQKVLSDIERDLIVWDIWENSLKLIDKIKSATFDTNKIRDPQIKLEAINLIKSIYPLIKNSVENDDSISIDSVIKNYHSILESFCRKEKNDSQIITDSENNRENLGKKIGRSLEFEDRVTALRILAAYHITHFFRYGYKLNYYRNCISHPNSGFNSNIVNLVFSHLVVCLYILGKDTSFSYIKQFSLLPRINTYIGIKDLEDLITHLESL